MTTPRAPVNPETLRWARERAEAPLDALVRRFPKYREWESGETQPTWTQLRAFAKAVHTGVAYFFGPGPPPDDPEPIPDFRTVGGKPLARPSLDLLRTIYACRRRQDWYREYALAEGEERVPFVCSARISDPVEPVAARMRRTLKFEIADRETASTWTDALRMFASAADAAGVLVMVSGIVGNDTRRRLDAEEFRGFAMADDYAPLVFVNGADAKAAQMFTLAHELAHIWLGETALSDARPSGPSGRAVERWCNSVAAEFLVPLDAVREERCGGELATVSQQLARRFKVSKLVILRRMRDAGHLAEDRFQAAYREELQRSRENSPASGGNFYPTLKTRVGRRFAYAIVARTLEGRNSFTETFRLLGIRKSSSLEKLAAELGVNG